MIEDHSSCIRVSDTGICPKCYSKNIIKNGKTKTGKQQYFCKSCNKRFIDYYSYNGFEKNLNSKIIQCTKEGLGIRSTARILKISTTTLLKRILIIAKSISQPPVAKGKAYEMDELQTFVKTKATRIWLAYAIDVTTRNAISFSVGNRSNATLSKVIKTLQLSKAVKISTDKLKNYKYLIDPKIHSTKKRGTNHIERKNLTLRTHLKRLNRKTICFSRSLVILNSILKIYFWGK